MSYPRIGAQGADVAAIHQALVEAGFFLDDEELMELRFGVSTDAAVRDFQAALLDEQVRPLTIDGVVGPRTRWALEHPSAAGVDAFHAPGWHVGIGVPEEVTIAAAELGVHETSPNRGPRVDRYCAPRVGIPWCAAFVSFCFLESHAGSPFGQLFAARQLAAWGEEQGCVVSLAGPFLPGDVFVILRGRPEDRMRRGHTGFIVAADGPRDGEVCTIEGNAANAVRGLVRPIASFSCIIRPRQVSSR